MNVPEWLRPYVEPFRLWREERRKTTECPPPVELGKNLDSLDDVATWLSHPSNWIKGSLDIIKWEGMVPRIADSHAWELAPGSWGRNMLLTVVLMEHVKRKRGRRSDAMYELDEIVDRRQETSEEIDQDQ